MLVTSGICLLVSITFLYWYKSRKYRNFPPGPFPWPIIGNILMTGKAPHYALAKLAKKYGPIVGMTMGPNKVIYIHGAKLIREALAMPEFSGKFFREAAVFLVGNGGGIVNSEGEMWAEQRRFALRNLRDFGFGKSCMEELIQENVKDLIDWLKRQNGSPVSMQRRFRLAILNSLWQIMSGQRFNHDDSQLFDLLNQLERTTAALFSLDSVKGAVIYYYPGIAKMFPNWSGWKRMGEEAEPKEKLLKQIIQEHLETQVKGEPRDFVDTYIEEINQTTDPKSSFHPNVGYNTLKTVMADMFVAGNDTTASSTTWAMVYMHHFPHVQIKLQQELDRVVGRNRLATLSDRKMMPYAEAVVNETLRLASITAVNLVHQSTEDVKFHGFDIPKGTHIFGNLWQSHHDPEIWGDPEVFRPERFLTPDESRLIKHEAFIPFSTGKRLCIGITFALDSLFLFITNLVHTFKIIPPQDSNLINLEINFNAITLAPLYSTMIFKERDCDPGHVQTISKPQIPNQGLL